MALKPNLTCLDASVVLEMLFRRDKAVKAQEFIKKSDQIAITSLSVHIVVYFGLKATSLRNLQDHLEQYRILDLTDEDVAWAFAHCQGNDFEDALQVASAQRNGCQQLVTLDRKFAERYQATITTKFL